VLNSKLLVIKVNFGFFAYLLVILKLKQSFGLLIATFKKVEEVILVTFR
jgi:hypothetical protein